MRRLNLATSRFDFFEFSEVEPKLTLRLSFDVRSSIWRADVYQSDEHIVDAKPLLPGSILVRASEGAIVVLGARADREDSLTARTTALWWADSTEIEDAVTSSEPTPEVV